MARRGENIYKRKDGRWEGRYKCGFNPDGKVKYRSVYGKNYLEVKKALTEKRLNQTLNPAPAGLTVKNLFDLWFENIKLKVKESTYSNYFMKYQKHILPKLGKIVYEKLTPDKLNEFIREKLSANLSEKYVLDIAGVIKNAFGFAKKQYGYADKSEFIIVPKTQSKKSVLLKKEEQDTLNSFLIKKPTLSNIGILTASVTGIRIGELCGLKWSDIDFEKKIITVRRTVQRIKNFDGDTATKLIVTAPKSASSVRQIPLPDFLVPALKKFKSSDNFYVLSGTDKPLEPRTVQYRFKKILKYLGLPSVNFHALRHMFATNCVALGFDVKTLSELLGHSSVNLTLNRYVHSSIERKAELMKRISNNFTAA